MYQPHTLRLLTWARLVGLALLLGLGLLASLGLATRTAHAATTTITTCDETTLRNAISNAASGDTIAFGCDGTIALSSPLGISKNLTLDGNGHRVTLDGNNSVQVLSVSSGVSFTLNALTVAHGVSSGYSEGGGIQNNGTLTITNSTLSNNCACGDHGAGGGISNHSGTVSISNSTLSGNSAPSGAGGGIFNVYGTISISNSTLSNNSAVVYGGIFNNSDTVTVVGSIVAGNQGGNCNAGTITDNGYNLDSDSSCFTASTSLHTNPLLSGLANNGGPTQTMALQQGSPAIDAIPLSANICPGTDQRGNARPENAAENWCDIGAYESDYPDDVDLGLTNLPQDLTVAATSSQGAVVTYTPPTATDESGDSPGPSVSCIPASGSTFTIGTTTVTCTATDSDDVNSPVSVSFTVTVNDTDLGLSNLPSNITTDATSLQGATITYTPPTVVDEDSPLPTANCTPASGSTFAIGTTTVTCTVSDSDDTPSSVSQSFTVTVKDTDLGLKNLPANITTDATSPQGATVTYTPPTVVDEDSPLPTVSCSPASGSTFAIGTTTVTCTVSDSEDTPSSVSQSFTVTVKGAAAQVNDLISLVNSFHLSSSLQTALDNKLQDVLTALNAGQTVTACSELTDFIGFVQSHTGKGISTSQATQLIAAARQIQAVLGC